MGVVGVVWSGGYDEKFSVSEDAQEGWKGNITIEDMVALNIADKNNIQFKSKFEASVAVALNFFEIDFSYCAKVFTISQGGNTLHYTPDFILSTYVDGKQVILEPHGSAYIDKRFLSRMRGFINSPFGNEYHVILLTDVEPRRANKLSAELSKNGMLLRDVCDEAWFLPYRRSAEEGPQVRGYRTNIYSLLRNFIEDVPVAQHERSRQKA